MRRLLLLVLLAAAGCDRSDADTAIELGHVYPPGVEPGDEERALRLAVEEWNKDPAKLPQGRPLRLRGAPGGSKPEEWGAQAARLIALNRVKGLIGGGRAAFAERMGTAAEGEEAVVLSTAGWAGPTPAQNLFLVGLPPAERGRALAATAKGASPKTVLIVRDPAAQAAGVAADRFVLECRAFSPPPGVRTVEVADAQKPRADVVFFACPAKTAVQLREQFKDPLLLFGDEDAELPALLSEGERAEGIVVATALNPDDRSERFVAFATRYQEQYKQLPAVAAVLGHDAISVWVEAARRADSLDAAAIRGELLKQDRPFDGLTGPLTFADDRTPRRTAYVGRISGGHVRPAGK